MEILGKHNPASMLTHAKELYRSNRYANFMHLSISRKVSMGFKKIFGIRGQALYVVGLLKKL